MRTLALALLLVFGSACNQPNATKTHTSAAHLTGTIGAAAYVIDVPGDWNGTLLLFSHGYVAPGGTAQAVTAPTAGASAWLHNNHFATAASAYSSSGWAIEDAFKDQIALLDYFDTRFGRARRVIAWGVSLGGIITAGLVQLYPNRFTAAMPLCGVLAGGVATWNTELDAAYAFKTLLAPGSALQLVRITNGVANLQLAQQIFDSAASSPQGRARLALVGSLIDLPGWFDPTQPEPSATDFAGRANAQATWEARADFPFAFQYRTELETRAGGNPSWNAGVDYMHELLASPGRDEVGALYRQAGLDLSTDVDALNAGARIKSDPGATAYLDRFISFDGNLSVPMLSVHTTGDGLVIPPNESAYAQVVDEAGRKDMLRQVFVHRAGHCAFTSAETIAAFQALVERLDTGRWDDAGLRPDALNAAAVKTGPTESIIFGRKFEPSFQAYQPATYPRPFAKGSAIPT